MHESIAKAVRRGDNRRIGLRADGYWERALARQPPERRGPWYRHVVEYLRNDPAAVTVWEGESGRAKHRLFRQVALVQDEHHRWELLLREVEARGFTVRTRVLPVEVSDHVVDRLLQRLAVDAVRGALGRLRPAILVSLALMPARTDVFLAPVEGGGAVIVVPSNRTAGGWCLITYVAEHQLRAEQRQALEANAAEASDLLAAPPAEGTAGGFLASPGGTAPQRPLS